MTDWHAWYADYDDPSSSLSQRLEVVRRVAGEQLAARSRPVVVSMCAGDGRDLLDLLDPASPALLAELDEQLAARARSAAAGMGLSHVRVVTGDAGRLSTYDGVRADVLLACGVFGNITVADVRRTVAAMRGLLRPGAAVIWTRGRPDEGSDPAEEVRDVFAENGFVEVELVRPEDSRYRVGVHRYDGPEVAVAEDRMFEFVR